MKLTPIAANRNIISYNDGTEVFFSYSTPVAGYSKKLGYIQTNRWYSSTTTRHINMYLNEYCDVPNPDSIPTVDPSVITNLVPIPVRY